MVLQKKKELPKLERFPNFLSSLVNYFLLQSDESLPSELPASTDDIKETQPTVTTAR